MKKLFRILVPLVVLLVTIFGFSGVVMAAGPTTVTINWAGTGNTNGSVNTGDTLSQFAATGTSAGTFTATDSNDNPYGYNVDTNSAYITGTVNGGSIYFQTNRNASYIPMYGVAGQTINAFVGSSGMGAIATGSGTNYAAMTNGTYGKPHTAGGYNFEAVGIYTIYQQISASGAVSGFTATGAGSALVNDMTTGASGATNVNLGWGGGCYTNANAVMTGAGTFGAGAVGSNSITTPIAGANGAMVAGGWTGAGDGSFGSVALNTIINFVNGASVGNFSIKVN